jgi:hypothetical protein
MQLNHVVGRSVGLFAAVCAKDLEGIVAKWKHGRYHTDGGVLLAQDPESAVLPDGRPAGVVRGAEGGQPVTECETGAVCRAPRGAIGALNSLLFTLAQATKATLRPKQFVSRY